MIVSAERLRYVGQIAASSLYVAGFQAGSDDAEQASRMRLHLSHPLLSELVELGEKILARQRSTIGMAKLPFHALVQDALQEMES